MRTAFAIVLAAAILVGCGGGGGPSPEERKQRIEKLEAQRMADGKKSDAARKEDAGSKGVKKEYNGQTKAYNDVDALHTSYSNAIGVLIASLKREDATAEEIAKQQKAVDDKRAEWQKALTTYRERIE